VSAANDRICAVQRLASVRRDGGLDHPARCARRFFHSDRRVQRTVMRHAAACDDAPCRSPTGTPRSAHRHARAFRPVGHGRQSGHRHRPQPSRPYDQLCSSRRPSDEPGRFAKKPTQTHRNGWPRRPRSSSARITRQTAPANAGIATSCTTDRAALQNVEYSRCKTASFRRANPVRRMTRRSTMPNVKATGWG